MKRWGTSRFLVLTIVMAGLLTFFYPSVTTDPPVAGISRWSPFEIVRQSYIDALPRNAACEGCSDPAARAFFALPFLIILNYLFLLAAAGTLLLSESGIVTMLVAFFGADNCLWEFRGGIRFAFEKTFGLGWGHVHYKSSIATQLVVMVALFLAGMALRDQEQSAQLLKRSERIVDRSAQPQVIDAEIFEEDDPENGTSQHPRLHD